MHVYEAQLGTTADAGATVAHLGHVVGEQLQVLRLRGGGSEGGDEDDGEEGTHDDGNVVSVIESHWDLLERGMQKRERRDGGWGNERQQLEYEAILDLDALFQEYVRGVDEARAQMKRVKDELQEDERTPNGGGWMDRWPDRQDDGLTSWLGERRISRKWKRLRMYDEKDEERRGSEREEEKTRRRREQQEEEERRRREEETRRRSEEETRKMREEEAEHEAMRKRQKNEAMRLEMEQERLKEDKCIRQRCISLDLVNRARLWERMIHLTDTQEVDRLNSHKSLIDLTDTQEQQQAAPHPLPQEVIETTNTQQ